MRWGNDDVALFPELQLTRYLVNLLCREGVLEYFVVGHIVVLVFGSKLDAMQWQVAYKREE